MIITCRPRWLQILNQVVFLEFQKTLSQIIYTIQFTKGKECEENLTEEENCSLQSCPEVTNCQYSQWTTIEECIILFFYYSTFYF